MDLRLEGSSEDMFPGANEGWQVGAQQAGLTEGLPLSRGSRSMEGLVRFIFILKGKARKDDFLKAAL